ncbi:hypothetical protein LR48_Vigan11g141300 [Vigna angularis]|uniref:Uncharacterized protein n=2 Tax=Phaseolus angularis TaxID=3914 RepID=A0A0L9VUD2_PHAAN|nr:hypothetical protein LR48_Vigan11g141300 [Vigna angularis]
MCRKPNERCNNKRNKHHPYIHNAIVSSSLKEKYSRYKEINKVKRNKLAALAVCLLQVCDSSGFNNQTQSAYFFQLSGHETSHTSTFLPFSNHVVCTPCIFSVCRIMEVEENTRALQREVPERAPHNSKPWSLFVLLCILSQEKHSLLLPRIHGPRDFSKHATPLAINKWQLDFQILLGPNQCFLCLLLAV